MQKTWKTWASRSATLVLTALGVALSFQASSEDIEIFSSDESSLVGKPNVLIVLDNSANWSRQSQKWPGGLTQGQSEARAIKSVLETLEDGSINVGLFEYSTEGNANTNEGGYVRHHVRPLTTANKTVLFDHLDTIFDNINEPIEKRSSGNGFGTLMWDVYNYLGEFTQSQSGAGTPGSRADSAAYKTLYSNFRSPLTAADFCRRTIVIFIGNNVQSGPSKDAQGAIDALAALTGEAVSDIPFAEYQVIEEPLEVERGYSTACYADAAACSAAENNAECGEQGFDSCYCNADDSQSCLQSKFTVVGTSSTSTVISDSTTTSAPDLIDTGENGLTCANTNKVPAYTCPADAISVASDTPAAGQTTTTTTSWSSCEYVNVGTSGCKGQKANFEPRGVQTVQTVVTEETSTSTSLGLNASCSLGLASCDTSGFSECSDGTYSSCVCTIPSSTDGCPVSATGQFQVVGRTTASVATPTGTFGAPSGGPWVADEWAKYLRQQGVPLPGSDGASFAQVSTYTIDVFNAQQNPSFSGLLFNMARVGGGKYYQATKESEIVNALTQIFDEVQAVNSAFSSASLPVNATNRAQSENQVYIGVFKPDRTKDPRWFGNLKRYQLIVDNGLTVELGDSEGKIAINNQTGFISDCAVSFWTTDSGDYWSDVISDDPAAYSQCATAANPNSDYPDGPFVEKGAAAQILRRSNDDAGAPDANGDYAVVRNMKTLSGSSLIDISSSALSADDSAYVRGKDNGQGPQDEDADSVTDETRASIHGDVIHSRPQPVNFDGDVVIYYGANDGAFRAVRGTTGEEIWSFVAPEHLSKISRLRSNSPAVNFSGGINGKPYFFDGSTGVYQNADNSKVYIYPSQRRGGRMIYAFDVSSPFQTPTFLWRRGCPNQGDDVGCSTGFSEMGQTWSRPSAALIKGFSESTPVLIFGGGYDTCEDKNDVDPGCSSPKGAGVYVVNAATGALIKYFDFSSIDADARSVAADITLADPSGDGLVDYAYAVTTGGEIYRLDFTEITAGGYAALGTADWKAYKVASTEGDGRKFLFAPTIINSGTEYYVAIGSGDREHPLEAHYPFTDVVNRFYVFRDDLTDIDSSTTLDLDDTSVMEDYTTDPECELDSRILPGSDKKGWFINLTEHGIGEQVVTSPVVAGGLVYFSTNRPTPESATECSTSLGEARGYIVNLLNSSGAVGVPEECGGDRSGVFTGGGLPPSPVIASVPIEVDGETVIKTVIIGAQEKDGSVSSIVGAQQIKPTIPSVRRPVSWSKDIDSD